MKASLAETGALSQLVSEPGDPVGKPVPGRKEWLEEEGGCREVGEEDGPEEKSFLMSSVGRK